MLRFDTAIYYISNTLVIVIGTGFDSKSSLGCKFGGKYSKALFHSPNLISCLVPKGDVGYNSVYVTSNNIDWILLDDLYQYIPSCQVFSITPRESPRGFKGHINITGDFKSLSILEPHNIFCKFGRSKTSVFILTTTCITCPLPEGDHVGVFDFDIVDDFGASLIERTRYFEFVEKIKLINVTPSYVYTDGSTMIQVEGLNLKPGIKCLFDMGSDKSMLVNTIYVNETTTFCENSNAISLLGNQSVIKVSVSLALDNLVSTSSGGMLFKSRPVIKAIHPSTGKVDGGTLVRILASTSSSGWANTPQLSCRFGNVMRKARWINLRRIECVSPSSDNLLKSKVVVSVSDNGVDFSSHTGIDENQQFFEYKDLPIVSSISPEFGIIGQETPVILFGERFFDTEMTQCVLISDEGFHFIPAIVLSQTSVVCHLPSLTMNTTKVNLEVSINGEEFGNSSIAFDFVAQPRIASYHPNVGYTRMKTEVILNGYFIKEKVVAKKCLFGNSFHEPIDALFLNDTSIICSIVCPDEAGLQYIKVQLNGMTFPGLAVPFLCEPIPKITKVSPEVVSEHENLSLTIRGSNFSRHDKYCRFFINETIRLYSALFIDESSISCPLPQPHSLGIIEVSISKNGQIFSTSEYAQIQVIQQISLHSVEPKAVSVGGIITVVGSNFGNLFKMLRCEVGGVFGNITKVVTPNSLHCRLSSNTPIGPRSPLRLTWNGISFTEIQEHLRVDVQPLPTIDSISPRVALRVGGSEIAIHGSYFFSKEYFCIFGTSVSKAHLVSSSHLMCRVPFSDRPGTVKFLLVSEDLEEGSNENLFYLSELVTIRSIYPRSGTLLGSTNITLVAVGLDKDQAYECSFDGKFVQAYFLSSVSIMCQSPPWDIPEMVDLKIVLSRDHVSVSVSDTNCAICNAFMYYDEPAILNISSYADVTSQVIDVAFFGHNFPADNHMLDVKCMVGTLLRTASLIGNKAKCKIPVVALVEVSFVSITFNGVDFFRKFLLTYEPITPHFIDIFPSHGSMSGGTSVRMRAENIQGDLIADW